VKYNWIFFIYHRLRSSASPVLTATGLVNGRWQFSTSYRQGRRHGVDISTPLLPQAIPEIDANPVSLVAGGFEGK